MRLICLSLHHVSFPDGSMVKNPPANAGDLGSILMLGRSPGERNGNPLQYSCLGNPWTEEPGGLQSMGSHVTEESGTTELLNNNKYAIIVTFQISPDDQLG